MKSITLKPICEDKFIDDKENEIGLKLYRSLGFEFTGNEDEDEVEMAMTV